MLSKITLNNINYNKPASVKQTNPNNTRCNINVPENLKSVNSENLKAYHPSFSAKKISSTQAQLKAISKNLDKKTLEALKRLERKGILTNNNSNDGSSVLENLYNIASKPRIKGLDKSIIIAEVIKALDNPYSITQKFGDIPQEVADKIEKETGKKFPENAYDVTSSTCVATCMEFNLAMKKPAEFVRFVEGFSGENYCVTKKVKLKDIASGFAEGIWKLRAFKTESAIDSNWEDIEIKIQPDRNAIVRSRVQSSYKDPNERSCIDVLIQSAFLNFGSQNTYNALTDEKNSEFNTEKNGLTDFEKTFVENVVFEKPTISVVYQSISDDGHLSGYNCELGEIKQHILNTLELGQNVIIGYTHLTEDKEVLGGHEITIIDYREDENGKGYFICNDTDDDISEPIQIQEDKLLPIIHHAGIPKEALNQDDLIVESWREIVNQFQQSIKK